MTDPLVTRTVARSVFVVAYLGALAVAGRPAWLAALLGVALVLVWLSPLLMTRGHRATRSRPRSRSHPRPRLP
jgi:hypothetical protein